MLSRYFYIAAGLAFLVGAVLELRPPRSLIATVLDLVAGAIFLFLGFAPQKARSKPPQ